MYLTLLNGNPRAVTYIATDLAEIQSAAAAAVAALAFSVLSKEVQLAFGRLQYRLLMPSLALHTVQVAVADNTKSENAEQYILVLIGLPGTVKMRFNFSAHSQIIGGCLIPA